MKTVIDKLNTLKKIKSTTEKVEKLRIFLKDDLFRMVVEMALDGNLHYNIKQLPDAEDHIPQTYDWPNLSNFLFTMAQKHGTSKQEKQTLANMCNTPDSREVVTRILNKDLKCGVAAGLVNQVIPDCLNFYPYMRCSPSAAEKNITYPAFVQNKEDGAFLNVFVYSDRVEYKTRNGNTVVFPEDHLAKEILATFPIDERVYTVEARVMGKSGKWLDRKTGNGIVTKALTKNQTMREQESVKVHLILWDSVTMEEFRLGKSMVPYKDRIEYISWLNYEETLCIHMVGTVTVNNFKEAQDFALEKISLGDEGAVLKDKNSIWFDGTSTKQIKLKAGDVGIEGKERECELRVVGIYLGKPTTKYADFLGGVICESEDNGLNTNVGGGFTDKQRLFPGLGEDGEILPYDPDTVFSDLTKMYVGKVITVRFNEIIRDKNKNKPRLFLARFIEVRHDKHVADTLKQIEEICEVK